MAEIDDLLADVASACEESGRHDLAERLEARARLLARPSVCVVVAGEFKTGKSSLVNALVGEEVCPVDDHLATAVPTILRFAEERTMRLHRPADESSGSDEPLALDELSRYASERGKAEDREGVQAVEVGLPAPLLQDGLVVVDTPGVGGLASQYTASTLASLSMAQAMLFVSDATQEYTGPELEFLRAARQSCPDVVPVLTKIDIAPEWERIRELDQGWLGKAGLDGRAPAPTSAALSLKGRRDGRPELEDESGIAAVVGELRRVLRQGRHIVAADALAEARSIAAQLAAPLHARLEVVRDPKAVIEELERTEGRGRRLAGQGAEWLLMLDDGIADLEAATGEEASRRLRAVLERATQALNVSDPSAGWDEFEAALTREVGAEVSVVSRHLVEGANELAARIADHFAEEEAAIVPVLGPVDAATAGSSSTGPLLGFGGAAQTPWRGVLVDAGWGGVEALGVLASILTFTSISLFNPFSLVIGLLVGGKTLRQARQRQIERRREQAVDAVTLYLADARQAADREWQTMLRRVRRELRTAYQRRADALSRSAQESLAAARAAVADLEAGRRGAPDQLAGRIAALSALDRRAQQLAAEL